MNDLIQLIIYFLCLPIRAVKYWFLWPNFEIIYKSGARKRIFLKNITIKYNGGKITKVEWESKDQTILLIGVDEIAAIYQIY